MGRLLTSAAAAAFILTGISAVSFAQDPNTPNRTPRQQPPESYQQPTEDLSSMPSPKKSSPTRKNDAAASRNSSATSKETAQGHQRDNVAEQLNACAAGPASERQACMDQASRR
jgi:hypothetical protein